MSQLVVNSKGHEKSHTGPLLLNPTRISDAVSSPNANVKGPWPPPSELWLKTTGKATSVASGQQREHIRNACCPLPNLVSLGIWLERQKNTFLPLPSPEAHRLQLHMSSDGQAAPKLLLYYKELETPKPSLYSTEQESLALPQETYPSSTDGTFTLKGRTLNFHPLYQCNTLQSVTVTQYGTDSPDMKLDWTPGEAWTLYTAFKSPQIGAPE